MSSSKIKFNHKKKRDNYYIPQKIQDAKLQFLLNENNGAQQAKHQLRKYSQQLYITENAHFTPAWAPLPHPYESNSQYVWFGASMQEKNKALEIAGQPQKTDNENIKKSINLLKGTLSIQQKIYSNYEKMNKIFELKKSAFNQTQKQKIEKQYRQKYQKQKQIKMKTEGNYQTSVFVSPVKNAQSENEKNRSYLDQQNTSMNFNNKKMKLSRETYSHIDLNSKNGEKLFFQQNIKIRKSLKNSKIMLIATKTSDQNKKKEESKLRELKGQKGSSISTVYFKMPDFNKIKVKRLNTTQNEYSPQEIVKKRSLYLKKTNTVCIIEKPIQDSKDIRIANYKLIEDEFKKKRALSSAEIYKNRLRSRVTNQKTLKKQDNKTLAGIKVQKNEESEKTIALRQEYERFKRLVKKQYNNSEFKVDENLPITIINFTRT